MPGDRIFMHAVSGTFHAAVTDQGPRAWLGNRFRLTVWPDGMRVRFDPTELLGRDGDVLASEGDYVRFPGGEGSLPAQSTSASQTRGSFGFKAPSPKQFRPNDHVHRDCVTRGPCPRTPGLRHPSVDDHPFHDVNAASCS